MIRYGLNDWFIIISLRFNSLTNNIWLNYLHALTCTCREGGGHCLGEGEWGFAMPFFHADPCMAYVTLSTTPASLNPKNFSLNSL